MKSGGQSSGVGASGGLMEPTSASAKAAGKFLVGESFRRGSIVVAMQAVAAAKSSEAGDGAIVGADYHESEGAG
jgi:hypothetical protein